MKKAIYDQYLRILKQELILALGCTEPIALAFCAAKAREFLGEFPNKMNVTCSGNIIKNVKGVKVPNSGGLKGVEIAAILGVVGGDAGLELEVLGSINDEDRKRAKLLLDKGFCSCHLKEAVPNLFIEVEVFSNKNKAKVRIERTHTNITYISKNGETIFLKEVSDEAVLDKSSLNIVEIVEFANEVRLDEVREMLQRQIKYNYEISEEGLKNSWGAQIGRLANKMADNDIKKRAIARASAASDARMSGCSMPVVINSGSGNQGMTCSIPVIEYARSKNISEEKLMRALCISNLIAQDQKRYIGALSAYCGVVCAAAGAGAGITYLCDGTTEQIANTVINTVANIGGMICDGAKPSCASKIYSALSAAILGHEMAMNDIVFETGEGLVMDNAEDTIKAIGHVGRVGMKSTDNEILNLMIGRTKLD